MQQIRSKLALMLGAFTALLLALAAAPGCTSEGFGTTADTDTDTGSTQAATAARPPGTSR